MNNFRYALDLKEYTWQKALTWEIYKGHRKKAQVGEMCDRMIHNLIATAEFFPIVSQIASVIEMLIIKTFGRPATYDFELSARRLSTEQRPNLPAEQARLLSDPLDLIQNGNINTYSDEQLDKLADSYHIRREGNSTRFKQFIKLHIRLWNGSPRYQEIIKAIEMRKKQRVAVIDQDTAIKKLQALGRNSEADTVKNFAFRACWYESLNAVILMKPDTSTDEDLGSVMAFEMTNGYQQDRFDDVHQKALNGEFINRTVRNDQVRLEIAATAYAHANEHIENDGRTIHEQIIDQAIKANTVSNGWHWHEGNPMPPAQRLVVDLILSEYGQKHIKYYEEAYIKTIAPHIIDRPVMQRVKKMGVLAV